MAAYGLPEADGLRVLQAARLDAEPLGDALREVDALRGLAVAGEHQAATFGLTGQGRTGALGLRAPSNGFSIIPQTAPEKEVSP